MNAHPLRWQAPQPLWARFGADSAAAATAPDQARPAILRFASDDFMEQMLGTLARDPSRLDALIARPETWRAPAAETADLVERTAIPRLAQSALRVSLARGSKAAVPATVAEATVQEQARQRARPLKLYQPAHQRFYLVAASLVCGLPGLPERSVVPGGTEQVGFVLRRLMTSTPGGGDGVLREFAFVKDGQGARWVAVGDEAGRSVAGEEILPVFPLAYQDQGAARRTLWSGMVPVGRREEYIGTSVDRSPAPALAVGQRESVRMAGPRAAASSKRARLTQFQIEVAEPWKNLIRSSHKASSSFGSVKIGDDEEPAANKPPRVYNFNLQQQHASWLILLDFADYLESYLPTVWKAVNGDVTAMADLRGESKVLYDWLGNAKMSDGLKDALKQPPGNAQVKPPLASLRAALKDIRAAGVRERLEDTDLVYTDASRNDAAWPPFHFVLAGLNTSRVPDGAFADLGHLASAISVDVTVPPTPSPEGQAAANTVDRLTALVGRALEARPETDAPPLPFALQLRDALAANVGDAGWFVVRFVYAKPDCGPLHPPVLSQPSQRFQLASFFDPDAPARPVRVTLPVDTTPAGLRKFNRNTAFVLSDVLCGQVQRAKGLGFIDLVLSVLPWPFHKDLDLGGGGACTSQGINIGMICSLSIPIVTICALILLIIIVSLLDYVFRWLPYLIFCFPVPGLKAKK
jgi:hypothetical protein